MTILNTTELAKQTGAGRYDTEILEEIITEAEREISGRLSQYGLSISSCNELKAASSLLSKAGLYDRMRMDGSIPGDSGARYYNLTEQASQFRKEAWAQITSYIKANSTYGQYRYHIRVSNA